MPDTAGAGTILPSGRIAVASLGSPTTVLPNFLVIGAMKSGTTSLAQYIGAHPDGFVTPDKEPDFFTRPDRYALGVAWYESLFAEASDAHARGEASTSYTKFPRFRGTPQRIAEAVPEVRLLYVVRDPIDRIRSQYFHAVLRGKEKRPLVTVLAAEPQYVANSRYGLQLDQYLAHFDREQILVLTSEQLRSDRAQTMTRVYGFLRLDTEALPPQVHTAYHDTRDQAGARPFDQRLRAFPGHRLASRLAPSPVKSWYKKFSTRRVEDLLNAADLPAEILQRLQEDLRADVERVRTFLVDDFDGWGLG